MEALVVPTIIFDGASAPPYLTMLQIVDHTANNGGVSGPSSPNLAVLASIAENSDGIRK
jgi:hypothetical protein